jgi:hypothetical protein
LSADFPWYLNKSKVLKNQFSNKIFDFQFTHTFYNNYFPTSSYIEVINPLIEKINPAAILRIKANLTTSTSEKVVYGMHTDYGEIDKKYFSGKTAVFYINTNNGTTVFQDGSEVESVENRLIIFDSRMPHSGTSCTNEKYRTVLNLNFFEWEM